MDKYIGKASLLRQKLILNGKAKGVKHPCNKPSDILLNESHEVIFIQLNLSSIMYGTNEHYIQSQNVALFDDDVTHEKTLATNSH